MTRAISPKNHSSTEIIVGATFDESDELLISMRRHVDQFSNEQVTTFLDPEAAQDLKQALTLALSRHQHTRGRT